MCACVCTSLAIIVVEVILVPRNIDKVNVELDLVFGRVILCILYE